MREKLSAKRIAEMKEITANEPLPVMVYYFIISLRLPGDVPVSLWEQCQRGELCLSPNVRLCSSDKCAHLATKELAKEFAEACLPRLRQRYGEGTELVIEESGPYWPSTFHSQRTDADSSLVRARLENNMLAPNEAPPGFFKKKKTRKKQIKNNKPKIFVI